MPVFLSVLVLLCFHTAYCQECSNPDAQVLILGGGMAGLAAANRLQELGITDFIILEGQDRLGGRMRTEELVPGVNVNVGANWIHGVDPAQPRLHPLFDLAERCGGLEGMYTDYSNIITYDSQGNVVSDAALRYNDYNTANEAADEYASNAQGNGDPDISARQALTDGGWVPSTPEDNFVDWYSFDFNSAESPEVSSLFGYVSDTTYMDFLANPDNIAKDYYVTDNRGTPALTQCLANAISSGPSTDERIRLQALVTLIEYSDECVCATANENDQVTRYCAPYAIVTFSVGVLNEGASTLFSPPLPDSKVNALSFVVNTFYFIIYSEFSERFWDNDVEFIGYVHPDRGYFPIIQIVPQSRGVNATAMHVTAELSYRLAALTEDALKAEVTQVFRSIYGDSVPEPNRIVNMPWGTNPLFEGSYSNIRTGGSQMPLELRRPEGRMYIAGEGASDYYGYMHGSYFSGISAANETHQQIISSGSKIVGNVVLVLLVAACKMAM